MLLWFLRRSWRETSTLHLAIIPVLKDLIAGKAGINDLCCVFPKALFPKRLSKEALLMSVTDFAHYELAMT